MHWLMLAGYCGFALINLSAAQSRALQIIQKPRYYGVLTGSAVAISCIPSKQQPSQNFTWYWAAKFNGTKELLPGQKNNINTEGKLLLIKELETDDSGVYFCKMDEIWGPGTGVQVTRNLSLSEALYRTQMKDGLIVLQGLLLAACIAALLLRKRDLLERRDSIYEEPETDNIYEDLAIETCGGGLYEELSVYAEADGAEAPWE